MLSNTMVLLCPLLEIRQIVQEGMVTTLKEIIDNLILGKIEYDQPDLVLSVDKIEESIITDSSFGGKIKITSSNKVAVKGYAYSSNARVKLQGQTFDGLTVVVEYVVDTHGMMDGSEIDGEIFFVTNAGEYLVPYHISVLDYSIDSSIGKIENYFHFANLVHVHYEEALELFVSKDFCKLLEKNDPRHVALYEGVMKDNDKRHAMEQFLIAINKKQKIHIALEKSQVVYKNILSTNKEKLVLTKDNWGYVNIIVNTKGDFLTKCKNRITRDDFLDNRLEYTYVIDRTKLYRGINYGEIIFEYAGQKLVYGITIYQNTEGNSNQKRVGELLKNLLDDYLDFRMHRLKLKDWLDRSLQVTEELIQIPKYELFARLYKAQLLLSSGEEKQTEDILDEFIRNRMVNADKNITIYCYYLYVRSLFKREAAYTGQVLEEISNIYDTKTRSWELLWIMQFLDDKYDINKSLKYTMIKSAYADGCRSPLMYYEALSVINDQPGLLRILNSFERQVILFGARKRNISEKLATRVAELCMMEKYYNDTLFNALSQIYEEYPSEQILNAICTQLIRGSKIGVKYFHWYSLGVEKGLRITNLYESYMLSLDDNYTGLLPKIIYMYFIYNGRALGHKQEYLYYNIVVNKKKIPNIYTNYKEIIEEFLIEQLFAGKVDEKMAPIYEDVLATKVMNSDLAEHLPDIAMTDKLVCNNSQMLSAVVIHKEMTEEQIIPLRQGSCYVKIYTEDPVILFVDRMGRRYASENYELTPLFDMDDYMKMAFSLNNRNKYLSLHFAEAHLKYHDTPEEGIGVFKNILSLPKVRNKYKQELISNIVDYSFEKLHNEELDDYLKEADLSEMDQDTKKKVIELCINRGLYEKAYDSLSHYGYEGISPRLLGRLCTRIILLKNHEYDPVLLDLVRANYERHIYNDEILDYLDRYEQTRVHNLIRLWQTEQEYMHDSQLLEERILLQTMFTKLRSVNLDSIFVSFCKHGIHHPIRQAFYVHTANHFLGHLYESRDMVKNIFHQLEIDLMDGMRLPFMCHMALLEYGSECESIHPNRLSYYQEIYREACNRNLILPFMKKYRKWFDIPFFVEDKLILAYRANPKHKVTISYTLGNGKEETGLVVEPMKHIFSGIFTKEIILFYGDQINYYISESGNDQKNEKIKTTDMQSIQISDPEEFDSGSRYDLLNKILIERERDTAKEEQLVRKYIEEKQSTSAFSVL